MNRTANPPPGDHTPETDSRDAILVVIDGPEDTTVRPAPPDLPREYPRPDLKPRPRPDEDKPKDG